MALCCIAFKGYAGGGTLPDAQGHDLKLSYSRTTLKTVADAITQQVGIVFSYEIALADYPMENLYVTEQGAALDAILKTVFTPDSVLMQYVHRPGEARQYADPGAVPVLKELTDNGCRLILFTMRHGKLLDDAIRWFRERGIPLYAVNENPSQQRWTSSPKVHADLYIDDSSLGCPIRFVDGVKRPVADWTRIREQLVKEGFLD